MEQFDITNDAKFERLSDMLAIDEGIFDNAKKMFGGTGGNLSKGHFMFDPKTDIEGNSTPEATEELRKIQEAFNEAEDGTVRVMFLQWLVKSPEVRENLKQLMASPSN